jgi:ribosomal protein L11 methyltransferase PrmA
VRATGEQPNGAPALPPGLLVEGSPARIAAAFPALCPLQPVRHEAGGLVCAPRAAPALAGPALARCPLPARPLAAVPGWPDPPAAMVAGWYRRSPAHAPAPAGLRELVQAPGEGFGPGDHPTTAMCLEALEALAPGPALACDLEPRALDQAARSLAAAGLGGRVRLRLGPAEALAGELEGAALLANLPAPAHRALVARIGRPPRAAVLSGLRPEEAGAVAEGYRALGLAVRRHARRGGFVCLTLAAP